MSMTGSNVTVKNTDPERNMVIIFQKGRNNVGTRSLAPGDEAFILLSEDQTSFRVAFAPVVKTKAK